MTRLALLASFSLTLLAGACNDNGLQSIGPNNLQVAATLSSVALASDCKSADEPPAGVGASPCAPDAPGCGGFCQQSSMQIDISAANGPNAVAFSIVKVRILDEQTGAELYTLTSRDPQLWLGDAYLVWDELIRPTAQLKSTYKLSAPDWSTVNTRDSLGAAKTFRVEVQVSIDGVTRTLVLDGVSQEPPVAT